MHIRLIWGKILPGTWDDYKKWYTDTVIPSTQGAKGLRGRRLLRGVDDPDEGISATMWDSRADLEAYERSEGRQRISQEAKHLYAGEYWIKTFEDEYSSD